MYKSNPKETTPVLRLQVIWISHADTEFGNKIQEKNRLMPHVSHEVLDLSLADCVTNNKLSSTLELKK